MADQVGQPAREKKRTDRLLGGSALPKPLTSLAADCEPLSRISRSMVSLMTVWNFAEAWEVVAEVVPDHPAQEQGDRVLTWRQFDQRANALAADLLDAGLAH